MCNEEFVSCMQDGFCAIFGISYPDGVVNECKVINKVRLFVGRKIYVGRVSDDSINGVSRVLLGFSYFV